MKERKKKLILYCYRSAVRLRSFRESVASYPVLPQRQEMGEINTRYKISVYTNRYALRNSCRFKGRHPSKKVEIMTKFGLIG